MLKCIYYNIIYFLRHNKYGHITVSSIIGKKSSIGNKKNLYIYEHSGFGPRAIIMNTRAKFIMKKHSGAAIGLTVVTGNHMTLPGTWYNEVTDQIKDKLDKLGKYDKDVIVNEDVWIGANVTLLSGVEIGRGAVIGAGSVCRESIPPYAVAMGNPAKIVGFKFSLDDIIEHEKKLYPENERIPEEVLENNYEKYYFNRMREIRDFLKL